MVSPEELINFAISPREGGIQVMRRMRMSRAYYGVFHLVRNALYPPPRASRISHEALGQELFDAVTQRGLANLDPALQVYGLMKAAREHADYDIDVEITQHEFELQISRARGVLRSLGAPAGGTGQGGPAAPLKVPTVAPPPRTQG